MKRFAFSKILWLVFAAVLFSSLAEAKIGRRNSYVTLTSQYSFYKDLSLNDSTATIAASTDVELAFKLSQSFYFTFEATQATDSTRSGYGIGARVDLPGFLFIGARRNSFRQKSKKFPVNTSAYVHSMLTENTQVDGSKRQSVASRYGFTIELFIFNEITYLTGDFSLYTLEGNSFLTYAVGLGAEF